MALRENGITGKRNETNLQSCYVMDREITLRVKRIFLLILDQEFNKINLRK